MKFNYFRICQNLFRNLNKREKEIILRRYGLEKKEKETLESIGKSWGITRERVRQIETRAFSKIKPSFKENQKLLHYFISYFKKFGGLKREDFVLADLGGKSYQNEILFFLFLGEPFQKILETKDFFSFWTIDSHLEIRAKKIITSLCHKLEEIKKPLNFKEIRALMDSSLSFSAIQSLLEISKQIQKNEEGLFGLKIWPEINPRGIRDKAYFIFKKVQTPLHFSQVAKFISPTCLAQTVHNELIKDPRFVWVGRGTYALKEWGYQEGNVKDIILKVLQEASMPLSKEEILEEVLKQRLVKKSTILANLRDKNYFLKDSQENYIVRES